MRQVYTASRDNDANEAENDEDEAGAEKADDASEAEGNEGGAEKTTEEGGAESSTAAAKSKVWSRVFKWQEKAYGPDEIVKYVLAAEKKPHHHMLRRLVQCFVYSCCVSFEKVVCRWMPKQSPFSR